jgi:hypothetical protein
MYALFLNHCLRQRLSKKEVKLTSINLLSQKVLLHFYSQVFLGGKWINIDSWGKKRGIPFGETIHMAGWKR